MANPAPAVALVAVIENAAVPNVALTAFWKVTDPAVNVLEDPLNTLAPDGDVYPPEVPPNRMFAVLPPPSVIPPVVKVSVPVVIVGALVNVLLDPPKVFVPVGVENAPADPDKLNELAVPAV